MTSLAHALKQVQSRIEKAAHTHVPPTLLAVSKTKPAHKVAEAYQLGQRDFGENYLQDALPKIAKLATLSITWHFIGAIQSNKAKAIAQNFAWVHTVERIKIADLLNQHAQAPLQVCIQVNSSEEPQKAGCSPEEVFGLAQHIHGLPKLKLRGIMVIPKPQSDFNAQRAECAKAKEIFNTLIAQGFELDTLSMGMSNDLEAAIAEGSTLVRIGTDIFGART